MKWWNRGMLRKEVPALARMRRTHCLNMDAMAERLRSAEGSTLAYRAMAEALERELQAERRARLQFLRNHAEPHMYQYLVTFDLYTIREATGMSQEGGRRFVCDMLCRHIREACADPGFKFEGEMLRPLHKTRSVYLPYGT